MENWYSQALRNKTISSLPSDQRFERIWEIIGKGQPRISLHPTGSLQTTTKASKTEHYSLLIHQGLPGVQIFNLPFLYTLHLGLFMPSIITKCEWPWPGKHDKREYGGSSHPQEVHWIRFPTGKRGWDITPWIFINLIVVWFWLVQIHNLARSKHNKEHQYLWEKDITWIQNVNGHRLAWRGSREDQGELPGVRRVGFHLFKITWPESLLHVQPRHMEQHRQHSEN